MGIPDRDIEDPRIDPPEDDEPETEPWQPADAEEAAAVREMWR